jgi:TatD DNase family protein
MLIDSHCHLDYMARDGQLEAVLERAEAAGVGAMLTICTRTTEFPAVLAIAEGRPNLWCTVGVHPHEAAAEPDIAVGRLAELARHPKVIGIGECGLDYHYDRSPREVQRAVFRTHIAAAREAGLPLVVHSRNADADTVALLREGAAEGALAGLIHCFSTTEELSEGALALGFYISLSGIVTFKQSDALRAIARTIPDDRILVETDAPYLAPVPERGKQNEPAFVAHTAALLAGLRGVEPARFAALTTDNFYRLFRKAARPA